MTINIQRLQSLEAEAPTQKYSEKHDYDNNDDARGYEIN